MQNDQQTVEMIKSWLTELDKIFAANPRINREHILELVLAHSHGGLYAFEIDAFNGILHIDRHMLDDISVALEFLSMEDFKETVLQQLLAVIKVLT